jgi:trehalose 6-phosphate synthase/phosphatase
MSERTPNEPTTDPAPGRLVVVSNRLPVVLSRGEEQGWRARPGSGGLVTAMAPVIERRGGVWIGWSGISDVPTDELHPALAAATSEAGYDLVPVPLSADEERGFYEGFANKMIWPLFHDLQTVAMFSRAYWSTYRAVNRRFAQTIAATVEVEDAVWIHDYHLMHVGADLREAGHRGPLSFFLHIPFPPLDVFAKLPWREQVLKALLSYDLLGFQTLRDQRNFIHCVRNLLPGARARRDGGFITARLGERRTRIWHFPIGIDFDEFADHAEQQEVADQAWYLHEDLPERHIILGVDRLDYTKGIPERLKAFETFLERHPELHRKVTMVQVVVPSRVDLPSYDELKTNIERMVGGINGRLTQSGWVPIHYIFRSLDRRELLGYYRAAEVALVTPLKDGMNLVAKEYCASSIEGQGVLILSEFAGAAGQLGPDALLVNPHDVDGTAAAIERAITMPLNERQARMTRLREGIRSQDVHWWVEAFMRAWLG